MTATEQPSTEHGNQAPAEHLCVPLRSSIHEKIGRGRACVHLLTPTPPDAIAVNRGAIHRLNWQPRIIHHGWPCIAARTHHTLTLSFDVIGSTDIPHFDVASHRPRYRFNYQLTEHPDNPDLLIAVLQ